MIKKISLFLLCCCLAACTNTTNSPTNYPNATIVQVLINGTAVSYNSTAQNIPTAQGTTISLYFSNDIDLEKFDASKITLSNNLNYEIGQANNTQTLNINILQPLTHETNYTFAIVSGEQLGIKLIDDFRCNFTTVLDSTPDFPLLSDDELLTRVQQYTFRYFWDYAHPISGLARERLGSGETVTTGGSGFGIMTIPMAIERGFITRAEGLERLQTIVHFLGTDAQRFHGAFPHWLNGSTGAIIPFGTKDNGGDLVETAFLMQGLLTAAQYFNQTSPAEQQLAADINQLWRTVEWDWYTQGQQKLFWHWSSSYGFEMNMPISGWNEGLIVYILAAASPTHSIARSVYENGWANNGRMANNKTFYSIQLPLGSDYGGPMFFAHYSFLGLDPRHLSDQYANYWTQNVAHAQINHAYCAANPKKHSGYSTDCWGLTASDIKNGYTASSPTNDGGTIAPTAALASMPYTPAESMAALKFFYYVLGDRLWGEYGFRDAFNLSANWTATSYLAIDQGPIAVMIENYRSGLLWNTFMQHPDVRAGLDKLGFSYK